MLKRKDICGFLRFLVTCCLDSVFFRRNRAVLPPALRKANTAALKLVRIAVLLSAVSPCLYAGSGAKRILLIDSYSYADPWVVDLHQEFRSELGNGFKAVNYEVHQLGVRYQPGARVAPGDIKALQWKLDARNYDLVIAVNNDACDLFLRGDVKIGPGVPLLFMRYNGIPPDGIQQKLNVTGLLSAFRETDNFEYAMRLKPDTERFYLVTEGAASGRAQLERFRALPDKYKNMTVLLSGTALTTPQLMEELSRATSNSVIIFNSWCSVSEDDVGNTFSVLPKLRKSFPGLILGRLDSYMRLGLDGGVMARSGREGKAAALLAKRILSGERPSSIPFDLRSNDNVLDYGALSRLGIDKSGLPSGIKFENVPPDFLTRHRYALTFVGAGAVILLALSIFLMFFRRRYEKRAMAIFEKLPMHITVYGKDELLMYSNSDVSRGRSVAGEIRPPLNMMPEAARRKISAGMKKAFESDGAVSVDYDLGDSFRHAEILRFPQKNPFGREAVLKVSLNVTDLQRARVEASKTAELLRLTLESIGDGVIVTDKNERVTLINSVASALTGYGADEAAGMRLNDIFRLLSYTDGAKVESPVTRALASGSIVTLANHVDLVAKDGSQRHIADSAAPIIDARGEITGAVLVFRDVTEEYAKRDRMALQNMILKSATEVADIAYFSYIGECGKIVRMQSNGVGERFWGTRDGEKLRPEEWIVKDDLPGFYAAWKSLINGRGGDLDVAYRSDFYGELRHFRMKVKKELSETGHAKYSGIIQDITVYKRNEFELKDATNMLASILDNIPCLVFVKDYSDSCRYVVANREFREMSGIEAESFAGLTDFDIFEKGTARRFLEDDRRLVESGEKILDIFEEGNFSNGKTVKCHTIKTCMNTAEGRTYIIGLSMDVTEFMRTQERLQALVRRQQAVGDCMKIALEPDADGTAPERMLERVGRHIGADECCIYIFDDTVGGANFFEWSAGGAHKKNGDFRKFPVSEVVDCLKRRGGGAIMVDDAFADDFPELSEMRPYLARRGVGGMLLAGLRDSGSLHGFIGFGFSKRGGGEGKSEEDTVKAIAGIFELYWATRKTISSVEKDRSKYETILNSVQIPVLMFGADRKIISANSACVEMAGCGRDELLARPCHMTFCGGVYKDSPKCPIRRVIETGKPAFLESDDHLGRHLAISAHPVFNGGGEVVGVVESIVDLTEFHKSREALIRAMDAAKAAERAKSTFLATMSHEIRTPLNAIIGLSDLLACEPGISGKIAENIASISVSGHALLSILNDVLQLSKLESGKLKIEYGWISRKKVFDEIGAIFAPLAAKKSLFFKISKIGEENDIFQSEPHLRQVLLNVVGNAVKFTERGGIKITTRLVPKGDSGLGDAYVWVKDTGCGIPEDSLEHIFDPFEQSKNSGRYVSQAEGTGLGLAIVSKLLEQMNGKISVKSEVGVGSEFLIELFDVKYRKSAREGGTPAGGAGMKPASVSALKVWVVDDVELNCKVMSMMLQKLGVESEYMTNPQRALERLNAGERPDVVFTDMWMPGMNGEELARLARQTEAGREARMVAVTADMEAGANFATGGFDKIMYKPISIESLGKVLAELRSGNS